MLSSETTRLEREKRELLGELERIQHIHASEIADLQIWLQQAQGECRYLRECLYQTTGKEWGDSFRTALVPENTRVCKRTPFDDSTSLLEKVSVKDASTTTRFLLHEYGSPSGEIQRPSREEIQKDLNTNCAPDQVEPSREHLGVHATARSQLVNQFQVRQLNVSKSNQEPCESCTQDFHGKLETALTENKTYRRKLKELSSEVDYFCRLGKALEENNASPLLSEIQALRRENKLLKRKGRKLDQRSTTISRINSKHLIDTSKFALSLYDDGDDHERVEGERQMAPRQTKKREPTMKLPTMPGMGDWKRFAYKQS